jgi:hypothetical protein
MEWYAQCVYHEWELRTVSENIWSENPGKPAHGWGVNIGMDILEMGEIWVFVLVKIEFVSLWDMTPRGLQEAAGVSDEHVISM